MGALFQRPMSDGIGISSSMWLARPSSRLRPLRLAAYLCVILLSSNVPLLYVSKQMGHAKATTTLEHYAKWLPSGKQRFVNVLDTQLEKVGTKSWHQADIIEKQESEVVERIWWAV